VHYGRSWHRCTITDGCNWDACAVIADGLLWFTSVYAVSYRRIISAITTPSNCAAVTQS